MLPRQGETEHALNDHSRARLNNGLHQTAPGGVARFVRLGPVVEARPAVESECSTDIWERQPAWRHGLRPKTSLLLEALDVLVGPQR